MIVTTKKAGIEAYDLIYSADDDAADGLGYYWQRHPGGETSKRFATKSAALAVDLNKIRWK